VDRTSGEVRVKRIVVAFDCGLIINPDGVRNQVEGNILQSMSRALKEQVTWDESHITSMDWDSYSILKFSEVPDVEVGLINRPDQSAVGAGEPATITTAAAIANGIFNATGARVRQVPFTPQRVRAALG
jgi:nicotinate dehydrogenase subunit B